jgi:hypothetical protein
MILKMIKNGVFLVIGMVRICVVVYILLYKRVDLLSNNEEGKSKFNIYVLFDDWDDKTIPSTQGNSSPILVTSVKMDYILQIWTLLIQNLEIGYQC